MFQRRVEGYTMEIALHKVLHKCLISTAMSPVMDIQFRNGRFIRSKVRGLDQIGLFDARVSPNWHMIFSERLTLAEKAERRNVAVTPLSN